MDPYYSRRIDYFKKIINQLFLSQTPYKYDTIVGTDPASLPDRIAVGRRVCSCVARELSLSLRESSSKPSSLDDVDVYLTSESMIRTDVGLTNYTYSFSDIFRMLGTGEVSSDVNEFNLPGDPIAHAWIKKSTVPYVLQATAIYAYINPTFYIVYSEELKWNER